MRDVSFIGLRGMISRRTANARIIPRIVRECLARVYDFSLYCRRKSSIRPTVTSRMVKFSKKGATSTRNARWYVSFVP